MQKIIEGTKVKANGQYGRIIKIHNGQLKGMYDVRLFDGLRTVGDICIDESEFQVL